MSIGFLPPPNAAVCFFPPCLYLSSEGDSVQLSLLSCSKNPEILDLASKATLCKTHAQVLSLLEKIQSSPSLKKLIDFYHQHNFNYSAHRGTWPKGAAHPCSLDQQIDFVRYKIAEQAHGIRTPMKLSEKVFWFIAGIIMR